MVSETLEGPTARPPRPLAEAPGVRRLRVVQVVLSLETGGLEVQCVRLVERLDPARFETTVVTLQSGGWLPRRLEERGIPLLSLDAPPGFRTELIPRLAGLFRKLRADVVHCHNCKAFVYGGLASLLVPRARLILSKQGVEHFTTRATHAIGRMLVPRTAATIAVSEDIGRLLTAERWVTPDRLHIVPNSVDTDECRPAEDRAAARTALGLSPTHRVIGTVARLSPEKDQATLVRAFARVAAGEPAARLVIAGEGRLRGDLESLARELGVVDRSLFLGERQDVAQVMGAMDVLCLPSLTEGTSLTLLEAMACGLPIVATAVGGTPEVVAEDESGLLVPPQRPEELAAALLTVLRDPPRARRMGEAGRRIVVERFSSEAMARRYGEIYETVCSAGRVR